MKPIHTTLPLAIAAIMIGGGSKLQAVGAIGLAARLLASTRIPHDSDMLFARFNEKIEELVSIKADVDILIAVTDTIGYNIKAHIGAMDKDHLPTAMFLKARLDSLRDEVAHIVPDAMPKIQNAVFAVRALDEQIKKLTMPTDQVADIDEANTGLEHKVDPATIAAQTDTGQQTAELA